MPRAALAEGGVPLDHVEGALGVAGPTRAAGGQHDPEPVVQRGVVETHDYFDTLCAAAQRNTGDDGERKGVGRARGAAADAVQPLPRIAAVLLQSGGHDHLHLDAVPG